MRLTDLEPQFLRYQQEGNSVIYHHVETLAEAHGVMFLCPRCFAANGGRAGTHMVICWSRSCCALRP